MLGKSEVPSGHWKLLERSLTEPEEANNPGVHSSYHDKLLPSFQYCEGVWLPRWLDGRRSHGIYPVDETLRYREFR